MGSHNSVTGRFTGTMKSIALVLAFAAAIAADGFHAHGGRRGRAGRRGGRFIGRRGREESGLAAGGYIAPGDEAAAAGYASPSEDVPVYAGEEALGGYDASDAAGDPALDMLLQSIPGVPGEDYPIYAEVPETAFACDGQVDGGYYADPEAECQAFHICTADGAGGLAKYSFLCPNGTLFNQNYFICDWWFNFDCATAEDLYSLNDEIAAERDALAGASDQAQYGASQSEYAAPVPPPPADYADYPAEVADYTYDDAALAGYEETTLAAVESYLPPGDARRGRRVGGGSRRGGRRQGRRNQRRPSGRRSFRG